MGNLSVLAVSAELPFVRSVRDNIKRSVGKATDWRHLNSSKTSTFSTYSSKWGRFLFTNSDCHRTRASTSSILGVKWQTLRPVSSWSANNLNISRKCYRSSTRKSKLKWVNTGKAVRKSISLLSKRPMNTLKGTTLTHSYCSSSLKILVTLTSLTKR